MLKHKELVDAIARAQKGDQEAFALIYEHYSKEVYYHANKYVGNENNAVDILQDVMLSLYKNLPNLRSPNALRMYLYRATYNTCVNFLKQSRSNLLADDPEALLDLQEEEDSDFIPEEYAESKELRAEVIAALDELKPEYRSALVLFYYSGLSLKEMAEVLDTNGNNVKMRLSRARAELRRKMELRKEVVLRAMSVPILTQALRENADGLFTQQISQEAWQVIATELGLGVAITAIPAAKVLGSVTTGFVITPTVKAITLLVAVTVVGATVAVYNFDILDTGASSTQSGQQVEGWEESEETLPAGVTLDNPLSSQPTGDETFNQSSIYDIQAPGFGGAAYALPDVFQPSSQLPVQLRSRALRYPVGTLLTKELVLRDAGITTDLPMEDLDLVGLEQVNSNVPNRYAVVLLAPDTLSHEPHRIAIIITIEEE